MINKAVSNTGPILHLSQINLIKALNIFHNILIPEEVLEELNKRKIPITKKIRVKLLKPELKDTIKIFANQYDLDLGESEAITLALQEKADYFLTDDLDARNIAKNYNLNVIGTIGIILRAFREKITDRNTAIKKLKELQFKSSFFITGDLIKYVISEISEFYKK